MPVPALREFLRLFFKRGHVTAEQTDKAFATHWTHYEAHDGAKSLEIFAEEIMALVAAA